MSCLKGSKLSKIHKEKISIAHKGKKKPWVMGWKKGKSFTEEHKRKIGKARRGKVNTNKGKRGEWQLTKETRLKMSEARRGEKSSSWKGGISVLTHRIRNCMKYRQWRSDIFTRDDFTCQECNKKGRCSEAHHLKELQKILEENKIKTLEDALICEELWNMNNGQTLCKKCHKKHNFKPKRLSQKI